MDKRNPVSEGRIEINERGIGEISDAEIETRAREALETANPPPAPEEIGIEPTEWGVPPSSTGRSAVRITPEDEPNLAAQLVEEGIDEADHDQRVSAASNEADEE